jgi:DNA-binding transcriptional regulator YhcF (GntR family)
VKAHLDNERPIFLQIKEGIEADILSGALKPDEQIPSNSQLVSFYQINPVTVLKGVNLLADEDIIYKKRGVGMFVSPEAPALLLKKYRAAFERQHLQPLIQTAKPLGINRDQLREMIDAAWDSGEKHSGDKE